MPGIGVISNRNARLNKLHPELKDQLAYVIGSNGEVSSTASIDDAYRAMETFRRIGIDIIAISGGDGTAHRTMEILLDVYKGHQLPAVLLLPTGTQNMVPRSFGIEGSGLANLMLANLRYRHNVPMRCIRRNLLKVNGHMSFMFGTGLAARFMTEYYAGETNPKGATKLLIRITMDVASNGELSQRLLAPFNAKLRFDDEPEVSKKLYIFFCSFVERLPLHFALFPRCGREPGKFEVAYSGSPGLQVAKCFPAMIAGSTADFPSAPRRLASRLIMDIDNPEPYTLDGELYDPTTHFEIESGPEIDFVVPALEMHAQDENLRYSQCGPWSMRFLL